MPQLTNEETDSELKSVPKGKLTVRSRTRFESRSIYKVYALIPTELPLGENIVMVLLRSADFYYPSLLSTE